MSRLTLQRVLAETAEQIRRGTLGGVQRNPYSHEDITALLRELPSASASRQREIVQTVVLAHLPLAKKQASRHASLLRGSGLSREELVQEAVLGLLDAIERFDPEYGVTFGQYAVWWIRSRIKYAAKAAWRHVPRAVEADALDRYMFRRSAAPRTADAIADEHLVRAVVDTLPEREREVLLRRAEGAAFSEIGDQLGISLQRVAQIEKLAKHKVRVKLGLED